jgi:L-asparaginase II
MGAEEHGPLLVQAWRGRAIESIHQVVAAVCDADGRLLARYGDPGFVTYWRSSAKPFQLWPWIVDGTVDHWSWGEQEMAIICASHAGTDQHAGLVRRMLADLGLTEIDLQTHPTLKAVHECSGNHTGMLAACVRHGWNVAGYLAGDHPVQRACHAAVARAVDLAPEDVPVAPDGCGVAAFATSVTLAATAYARLAQLVPRAAAAMRAYPVLVEGEGLIDTVFMQAFPGAVSKDGAEGLGCAVLPDGRGLAVKALDGADRAMGPALIALALRCLGLTDMPAILTPVARPPRLNVHGTQVGELVAAYPD